MSINRSLKKIEKSLGGEKNISLVFLGIGLSLFLLNISGFLIYNPQTYSFTSFDVSVFSSMIIIIYTTYILHNKK